MARLPPPYIFCKFGQKKGSKPPPPSIESKKIFLLTPWVYKKVFELIAQITKILEKKTFFGH